MAFPPDWLALNRANWNGHGPIHLKAPRLRYHHVALRTYPPLAIDLPQWQTTFFGGMVASG
jgi:hypothetical protein